ncbi:non-ribosomal peptide synthetase [Micromonosporaceae bacterium Da 78-11]
MTTMTTDEPLHMSLPVHQGAELPTPAVRPVTELVADFVRSASTRVAVRYGPDSFTYGELDSWSNRLAAELAAAGVSRGAHVAVLAEPSAAMIAAALAVQRCGAAYVPIDPAQPDRRVAEIMADAEVAAVVVTATTRARLSGSDPTVVTVPADIDGELAGPVPRVSPALTDPAYLIYTSGSTGEPKGVVVEHGQLAASTAARRVVYPGTPTFLLVSPLSFDSSVAGLWGTLTAGGCVVVAGADEVRDPDRLVELIDRHEVTHLLCVPSLYSFLLDAAGRPGGSRLRSLRTAIVAGEGLPPELVDRHFATTAACDLVNEYGPTEGTVWASYHRFTEPGPVSIGRPIPGARLYVLDPSQRPVAVGEQGELYVAGAGVARGYHGRAAATAQAFLDDPFATTPGDRMYRTGDLARWTADGDLEFLGRRDHQVKIRGHRIELPAVEAHLCALPGVREAVVVPTANNDALTGFVLAPTKPAAESLRQQLGERLSGPMVPARIVVLDDFPRTRNGKIDRSALLALATVAAPEQPAAGPADPPDLTARVAAAWAEVLQRPHVPLDANFFDLGGHSLATFRLRETLERHTGRRLSVVALFRHTTVTAQAALLSGAAGEVTDPDADEHDARQERTQRARALRARRAAGLATEETR